MTNENNCLVIGTRGSRLAVWQSEFIAARLREKSIASRLEIIRTKGDLDQTTPLPKIGEKGLFTAELDAALIEGRIDLAVHSLKDLPTELPDELALAAVPERESPWDALVMRSGILESLDELPAGAVIGSSSLRRAAQLLALRPDVNIQSLRGNVETRLRKLDEGMYEAIILAEAGLSRLGYNDRLSYRFGLDELAPAVGQGALGIVCAADRTDLKNLLHDTLNVRATETAVTAERALLNRLDGGCHVPVGAHAALLPDGSLHISGVVASVDGTTVCRASLDATPDDAALAGVRLAENLLEMGAREILDSTPKP